MSRYAELGKAIEDAVRGCCEGREVAVAFSGGMDSGLLAALAAKYARSVTCYTCGTDSSFDVSAGRELADALGLPWVHCRMDESTIEADIREMILASRVSDPFTISYDLQLFTVCRRASEPIVLSGQGSDEYFGGCARSVSDDDSEYEGIREWGIERLMKVSVPCELSIARHFKKKLFYPYLDGDVLECVGRIDPEELRPRKMEDRKQVLKEVSECLGFPILAHRTKKASQYGSGTTDLIHKAASAKGVRFNRYIADIYESLGLRDANLLRDSAVDVRMDPILLHDAEEILGRLGITHSEALAALYRRMIEEGDLGFLKKKD